VAGLALAPACSNGGGNGNGPDTTGDQSATIDGLGTETTGEGLPVCEAGTVRCSSSGTAVETCHEDGSGFGEPVPCQDANPCSDERCEAGACVFPLTKCNDDDPCTQDICMPFSGDCLHQPAAGRAQCCEKDEDCSDGFEETTDLCDVANGACVFQADVPGIVFEYKLGGKGGGDGQLSNPKGLAVLSDGRLVVADAGNNRTVYLTPAGEQLVAVTEAFGKPLKAPACAYAAADGRVFVCDTGNDRILILDAQGTALDVWPPADFGGEFFLSPTDVAIDGEGFAYVADGPGEEFDTGNRIMKLKPTGQVVAMQGKTGEAEGNFDRPSGIALHSGGNLFITDQGNDRVQVLDPALQFVAQFGTEGSEPAQMKGPSDIAMAPSGVFFIADAGNQRIQLFASCQPDCTGKVCGDDGCGGSCGECPPFGTCNGQGLCDGWVAEGGDGCTIQEGAGCGGCPPEKCVCTGEGALDPSQFYEGGDKDEYCCATQWDQVCVYEAQMVCGYSCPLPTEWPVLEPTFSAKTELNTAGETKLASPLRLTLDANGFLYVLDAVKCEIYVFRTAGLSAAGNGE
jgi:sugar lactone lactonase YvrE